ncbi:dynein regulatory complex protein 1 [Zophobas morio]|uniref:dynein regulatory complex protein 1 n=1 Tax=Zophobas morio TaxID=2755281 RepID=UPI003082A260
MEKDEEDEASKNEDYEPTVFSHNPTERIMARQIRIQRRVDALRKAKELVEAQERAGDNVTLESEVPKTNIDLQVDKSLELLEKLILEGEEHVTNVRVATEAREADRREREGFGKGKLLQQLEEEAASAADMFNEIAEKWSGILKYNDPLHISDDIQSQKEKCDELIKEKNAIIADLREKLKKAEINFAVDQRKQVEDVNSIAKRIENQIIIMRKAYRQELQMVEDVIKAERQILIETNNKKWDELHKKRDQEEKSNADLRSEDYWKFVQDMDNVNRDFQELYRTTTIKLENECDELQREYERIKRDAIMNSEKLDYNYQILKKREDENLIIKSQQKRRINKLQDIINSLRKKNNDYHTQTTQQIEKLTVEIKKLCKNILDIENKADHLAAVNNEKFKKIWNMNKKRADELFTRVLDIDKVLHEQQLGLEWTPPEYSLPPKMLLDTTKTTSTTKIKNKTKSTSAGFEGDLEQDTDYENSVVYKRTIRHILNLIADKTGFLIEDVLHKILEPYLEYERTLVKVDNVFAALHLKEKSNIDVLFEFFFPYMFCPICNVAPEKITGEDESVVHVHEMEPVNLAELTSENKTKSSDGGTVDLSIDLQHVDPSQGGTIVEVGPLTVTIFDENLKGECRGPDKFADENAKDVESYSLSGDLRTGTILCQYQHPLMISSVYVLKALKEFLSKYHIPKAGMPTMSIRLGFKRSTMSRLILPGDVEVYWEKYLKLFPDDREQLWNSLLEGLKKYHELLKARKTASEEVVSLRRQNLDLRRVFANYIHKNDIPY